MRTKNTTMAPRCQSPHRETADSADSWTKSRYSHPQPCLPKLPLVKDFG